MQFETLPPAEQLLVPVLKISKYNSLMVSTPVEPVVSPYTAPKLPVPEPWPTENEFSNKIGLLDDLSI